MDPETADGPLFYAYARRVSRSLSYAFTGLRLHGSMSHELRSRGLGCLVARPNLVEFPVSMLVNARPHHEHEECFTRMPADVL